MKLQKTFLVLTTLFILLGSNLALAVSDVGSGDTTSSGEVVPPVTSGDVVPPSSGEIVPPISSGETTTSGETSKVLLSTANDSKLVTKKGTAVSGSMKATVSGDETFNFAVITQPQHGELKRTDESSASFSYTPSGDYVGNDSFTFRLESGDRYSNVATVSITVEDTAPTIPFNYKDMQNHWANYSASHLAARGYVIGEEIGNDFYFHADEKMTRGEFMLFLLSILDKDSTGKPANIVFDDEENIPDWFLKDAKVAYKMKLINGVSEGSKIFVYPDREITRAEAFVMINNALAAKITLTDSKDDLKYADKDMIPAWATQAIKNLTGYKIVQGGNGNNIDTSSIVTRGQAAELCFKLLKQIEASSLTPSGDVK